MQGPKNLDNLSLSTIKEVDVPIPLKNIEEMAKNKTINVREIHNLVISVPMSNLVFQVERKCFFFYSKEALAVYKENSKLKKEAKA